MFTDENKVIQGKYSSTPLSLVLGGTNIALQANHVTVGF